MQPVLLQNRAENLLRPQSLTAQCHIHAWQTMGSALRILGKGARPASPMGGQTNGGPTPLTAGDGMVPLHSWWSIQHIDLNYFIKNICTFYALLKAPTVMKIMTVFWQVSYTHPVTVATPPNSCHWLSQCSNVQPTWDLKRKSCGSVCCC